MTLLARTCNHLLDLQAMRKRLRRASEEDAPPSHVETSRSSIWGQMNAREIEGNNHHSSPRQRLAFLITFPIYLGSSPASLLPMACHELTEFEAV
jgi:hypothetical protein